MVGETPRLAEESDGVVTTEAIELSRACDNVAEGEVPLLDSVTDTKGAALDARTFVTELAKVVLDAGDCGDIIGGGD